MAGPARTEEGGGFVGGGLGLVDAAIGIAIAATLNAITTRTSVETVIRIVMTDRRELFALHTLIEPEALRIALSPAFAAVDTKR